MQILHKILKATQTTRLGAGLLCIEFTKRTLTHKNNAVYFLLFVDVYFQMTNKDCLTELKDDEVIVRVLKHPENKVWHLE